MGFFSSRKADGTENYTQNSSKDTPNDKSVANVIRSRFYGKQKGKEREELPSHSFTTTGASPAQTLSNPAPSSSTHIRQPSPLPSTPNAARSAGPSILRVQRESKSLPSTPSRTTPHKPLSNMGPPPSPSPSRVSSASALRPQSSKSAAPSTPRQPTDNVTITLAQRLNELAVANSEGLLNDDEYRLLRQNLFERFATTTTVPTEAPIVPAARPRPRGASSGQEGRPISRPLSNFQVEVNRSPSIRSKSSVTSGVASFLRRATSRRTPSNDLSDTSSIFSSASIASNVFKRGLSKKSSASSVRTATSRTQADTISISSRTGVGSQSDQSSPFLPSTPSASRSAASIRRFATPPSSFPGRGLGSDTPSRSSAFNHDLMQDDDRLQTTSEIRQEISAVEAEARRLMDAFNGLEMTTLAKLQRQHGRTLQDSAAAADSMWMMVPEGRSQRRVVIADSDVASLRSATSGGTAASMTRKTRSKGSLTAPTPLNSTRPGSLRRKNSSSSVGSGERKLGGRSNIPPVPALPASYGHLGVASHSNVSLARSHVTMSAVPEDEQTEGKIESEMDDIRRRRDEVSERYAARLEYLRAKLKGAQLHEKLARK
ncbi:hypothetical protein DXG03_005014 [Asterophora parasitica]|uniref:Uncharacterized protein n=1 Tax=Asterophora parasitica TaxID=117018 RepID=A0A9P7GFM6_9AGAR|nr:hypothetical protein DXG03_005014 [Asterophora parasitica]